MIYLTKPPVKVSNERGLTAKQMLHVSKILDSRGLKLEPCGWQMSQHISSADLIRFNDDAVWVIKSSRIRSFLNKVCGGRLVPLGIRIWEVSGCCCSLVHWGSTIHPNIIDLLKDRRRRNFPCCFMLQVDWKYGHSLLAIPRDHGSRVEYSIFKLTSKQQGGNYDE